MTGPLQVNTYLVTDDTTGECFVVDPGGHSDRLIEDIEKNGHGLKYVVLTHGHGDHIGGVNELLEKYSAKLLAGDKERVILESSMYNESFAFFRKAIELKADVYLKENDTFAIGETEFKVLETPGHTPGGLSFYHPGVVFTGDTLFKLSVGRTDFFGGSWEEMLSSIENKLYKLPDDTLVLPGHMESSTIGFEKKYNQFL